MDIFSAVIYGLIQGLSEFLPISSSGHLALLPNWLGINDPGVLFDLSMHGGTALAVLLYFRKEVLSLTVCAWRLTLDLLFKRSLSFEGEKAYCVNLIMATVVTFIFVILAEDFSLYTRGSLWIAGNLLFFGILMGLSDYLGKNEDALKMNSVRPVTSFIIGLAQGVAIFPGVSRSGITLTAARFMGFSRKEAGPFIFILSLPVIFGGLIFKFKDMIGEDSSISLGALFIGIGVSFGVGLFAIHFFLRLLEKWGSYPFVLYRVILALILFIGSS